MHELEHYELERRARYFDPMGQRSEGVSIYTVHIIALHRSRA